MGCDAGFRRRPLRAHLPLDRAESVNLEAQLAYDIEKKSAGGATRWCGAGSARAVKNKIRGTVRLLGRALGLITSTTCATARPPSCSQIGGLACSRFDPRQRSVILIRAVEVDHGLTSHLVGPDPLVSDKLVSLSLSEFAIAATVPELDEPAPLVVISQPWFLRVLR
jgi:hypothetical protein